MQLVQPIRDKHEIEEIKSKLKESGTRDLLLFCMGIYNKVFVCYYLLARFIRQYRYSVALRYGAL